MLVRTSVLRLLRDHRVQDITWPLLGYPNMFIAGPNKNDSFVVIPAYAEIERQRQMTLCDINLPFSSVYEHP